RSLPALLVIIMVSSFRLAGAQIENRTTGGLLESGAAQQIAQTKAGDEIKLVSYNIRWRSGKELEQIISWLKDRRASAPMIICLQEVDRAKSRSGNSNHAKAIADALGMYYAWAAPRGADTDKKKDDEDETGVEILSPYPLTDIVRIVLPNAGPGGRRRVAIA